MTHRTTVRVRYPETDRMGVAYHGHYFVWFELGRTELMRHLGCDYRLLEERDRLFFPVIDAGARYLSPARYDDLLTVMTKMIRVTGARVRFEYSIHGQAGVLATGYTEHASVGADGRPRRMPTEVRERLSACN